MMMHHDVTFAAYPIGAPLGPFALEVTAEMAERYASAVNSTCRWYRGDSPFGGPIAPYTAIEQIMLITLGTVYRVTDAPRGSVQYRLDVSYRRPARVGARLIVRGETLDKVTRPGRHQSSFAFEVLTDDGTPIIDGRVAQAHLLSEGGSGSAQKQPADAKGVAPSADPPSPECVDDISALTPGIALPPLEIPLTLELMRLYAAWPALERYGRELENQHTNAEEARRLGRPGVIAMGVHLVGFIEEYLLRHFGECWLTTGRLVITFVGMVLEGDTLVISAETRERTPAAHGDGLVLSVTCRTARGTLAVAGTAEVMTAHRHVGA